MLTLWRPFGGLSQLSRELSDFFTPEPSNSEHMTFAPAVDIEEKTDHFLVSADLPGMSEKDIEVKIQDGVLLLSGKREASREQKTANGYYSERSFGAFCRSFTLGEGVDPAKIEATYKNGVLTVKVPKAEEAKPREIPVSTN